MKKKSTSQSAFFNLRVLIGLFIAVVGVFLALLSFNGFTAQAQGKKSAVGNSADPLVPAMFDCSKIRQLGIDKQENFRAQAIMIYCGLGDQPSVSAGGPGSRLMQKLLGPLAFGGGDVDLITGTETSPNITQSETYTLAHPDNPLVVVAAYNDSRGRNATPINISGASVSTDGGGTFNRLTLAGGQGPFSNTVGDPVVLFHRPSGAWLTVWLDGACGGQGLGGYRTTTPEVATSWIHFPCVHSGASDDRNSGWSDNNPASPFYGRMYVSFNNFALGGPPISVVRSSDGGNTWSAPVQLVIPAGAVFVRDVQITGDLSGNGNVYIAGMDENGGNGCTAGCGTNRRNIIYRSTDGGATWTNTYVGTAFVGPCRSSSGFFCTMYAAPAYWRHMGWGQPAAFNNVVSYVYDAKVGSDPADVFYIRSTDSGVTFSAPMQLNSNTDVTKAQWQPNLSVSPGGTLLATWYDETPRTGATCQGNTNPCYQMHARKSNDNGVSFLPDDTLSDVATPLPLQPDPGIQPTYAGDYDYSSATAAKHVTSWTDGRVLINMASQQDAFTDRELVGFGPTSTSPACGSVEFIQRQDFVINLSDPVNPATVQATDFTVNGIPANSFVLSNANATITFHFNTSPVTTPGVQTMHIAAGAFNRASDNAPNLEFSCTFCYATAALQVTSTNPPVGGTFTPPAPGVYNYDVNFNQPVDTASVQDSDLTLSGNTGASVTGHSFLNGNMTVRFTLMINFGGNLTATIAAGGITASSCNPNVAFMGNYTVQGCPPSQYVIAPGTDVIDPGLTRIASSCDDCDTVIPLPFPFTLYGNTYNSVNASSNGRLDFVVANEAGGYVTACLPAPPNIGPYDNTIFPVWEDMRTDATLSGCAGFPTGQCGIFISTSGVPPNRIFNIEWRTVLFANNASRQNFEARLYENTLATNKRFDVVIGTLTIAGADHPWVSGVQGATGFVTQDFCVPVGGTPPMNVSRAYTIPPCNAATVSSAVSRKTHTGVGPFDITLPLTGTPGIECRIGGATNDFTMVVTFTGNVTVTGTPQAEVISGAGCVGTGGACMAGNNVVVSGSTVTIPLTNVTDDQTINVRLNGVNGAADQPAVDVTIPMTRNLGDTNANGSVNSTDIGQTKGRIGLAVDNMTFRSDVNISGGINSSDVTIIKQNIP